MQLQIMTDMNVLHQIHKMMQTIISQSSRNYYHDDFYVNLEKAVPFIDM